MATRSEVEGFAPAGLDEGDVAAYSLGRRADAFGQRVQEELRGR